MFTFPCMFNSVTKQAPRALERELLLCLFLSMCWSSSLSMERTWSRVVTCFHCFQCRGILSFNQEEQRSPQTKIYRVRLNLLTTANCFLKEDTWLLIFEIETYILKSIGCSELGEWSVEICLRISCFLEKDWPTFPRPWVLKAP